jgi:hypothetical protein
MTNFTEWFKTPFKKISDSFKGLFSPAAIPGIITLLISAAAPLASWQALWVASSAESRIIDVLNNPEARAVVTLYFHFASAFIASGVLFITGLIYLPSFYHLTRKFRVFIVAVLLLTGGILLYLFSIAGAAHISLEPYITAGKFKLPSLLEMLPTPQSPMTWIRLFLAVLGFLFAVLTPKINNIGVRPPIA